MQMRYWIFILFVFFSLNSWAQKGRYLSVDEFYQQAFGGEYKTEILWLNKYLLQQVKVILGHNFRGMRTRFKVQAPLEGQYVHARTAWIFEGIGKTQPITVGVVIEGRGQGEKARDQIVAVKILEFRESRGGEVRYNTFTDQFISVALGSGDPPKLDQSIDGITGATLSVRAVKKVVTLALFLHRQTEFSVISRAHEVID